MQRRYRLVVLLCALLFDYDYYLETILFDNYFQLTEKTKKVAAS